MSEPRNYHSLNAELNLLKDGKIQFDKDKDAAREYFLQHVNQNTVFFHTLREKLDYLFENRYYDKAVFDKYQFSAVKRLFQRAYAKKFRFQTFVGAYKYYTSYTLRTLDGKRYLERYEDRVVTVALTLAQGNYDLAVAIVDAIMNGSFQPATPTFLNAGRVRRGEYVSCFLVRMEDDMESIARSINAALQLSKRGGGVALNMTNIRETGAPIKGIHNMSSGVVPVMKMLEDAFSYANQLGSRDGAGAVYLHAHHPDIMKFLDTKRENADEKIRIKTLSLGIVVPDITFELAKNDEDMYLFSPYDVKRVYGVAMSDMSVTEKYREMVDNPEIKKTKIKARRFFEVIAEIQFESGYPYIMYEDTVNRAGVGQRWVNMSNLCLTGDSLIEVSLNPDGTDSTQMTIEEFTFQAELGKYHGVYVKSWKDGSIVWSQVSGVGKTGTAVDLVSIETKSGRNILCTPDHQIFTKTRGWIRADELNQFDRLVEVDCDGDYIKITRVELQKPVPVYDLTVPETESFFADGILVHNCTEILQENEESLYNDDLTYAKVGSDISCNLGSLNVAMAMDSPDIAATVKTAVLALNSVSHQSKIDSVPSIRRGNDLTHAIGLGQMNLHGFLARERIFYGSPESVDFVNCYFALVRYHSLVASLELARKYGPFDGFEKSRYADGSMLQQYVQEDFLPLHDKVKQLFASRGIHLPTREEWAQLIEDIKVDGIHNKYLHAVPPTGSISYINNSTASIHPIAAKVEIRKEGRIGRVYYPAPFMTNDNLEYYQDAYEIGPNKLIDVYAAATRHTDQGLSMTLFFPDTATTRDINKAQVYAWKKGIKTIYYIRLRQMALQGTDVEGCVSCSL